MYELIKISSITEVVEVLECFNNSFPRSIESRVGNLLSYAEKLAEYAHVYVTKENGVIVGLVIFYANDFLTNVAYLGHIAVAVGHQKKGIGSRLIQLSCILSKQNGMTKMKLEVDKLNSKAIACYEKHGFVTVGCASSDSQYMIKELT